ncbi:long-chain-fatty-acid--CoA ligase [Streptomyces sp. NPDC004726]
MHLTLAAVLSESAKRYPARTAAVCGDDRLSYAQLWHRAGQYAAALRGSGVGAGDRVALMLPNTLQFPMAYFGVLALGATVVPVNILLTPEEVAYVLKDSGARTLVADDTTVRTAAPAAQATGVSLLTVPGATMPSDTVPGATVPGACADGMPPAGPDGAAPAGPARLDLLAGGAPALTAPEPCRPDDAAVILYTSGTTGRPKGAVLTHLNMVMNATVTAFDTIPLEPDDIVLCCLPLYHSFGQTVTMNASLRRGAAVVLMPRFTGPAALETMIREKVTVFQGVPTMYLALLDTATDREHGLKLRFCLSGGAALAVAVLERVGREFETDVYEGYGLSETSPVATFAQRAFGVRAGTVGHPVWGTEAEIARADVADRIELLGPGEAGEIVIRGHHVFKEYLGRPEATAEAVVDGWFRTGDIGVKDTDGFVSIVDRKKDMILRGGYNVYPREIEEVLARHPGVAQVAVVGKPHATLGEEIYAYVVPRSASTRAEDITAWSRERLARYKYPRFVELVDSLPLGPTGKILKRELAART